MKISEIKPGKVEIEGWIENLRDKKSMQFIVIRDTSGKIQVTVVKAEKPEIAEVFSSATIDSTVKIKGEAVANEYVKLGGIEIIPDEVVLTSRAEALPIAEDSSIDQRIDYRWVDLRTEKNLLMMKVQTLMTASMREFLLERDFIEFHSPKLIATASESGSEVFEVKYFDKKAYLAQSPQFYKQMAIAGGLGKVFECAPVFRAEKSHSRKHATEFTGFDLEFSGISSYEDVMSFEEDLLIYTLDKIQKAYGEDIERVFGVKVVVPSKPFPKVKLSDLYKELEKRYGYTCPKEEQGDLTTEAEKLTYNLAKEVYNSEFMFVTDYSAKDRAFYHMRKDGVPQGYDLIWKGVEITTGAQREHRYDVLKAQAEEKGLAKDVEFYLQFFRYGCPPHGGFGLGIDRITMNLLELASIKEAMFLFRGPEKLTP